MKLSMVFVFLFLSALGLVVGAFAQPPVPDDASAIRRVIEGQWDAFAGGDGAKALSFATQDIRDRFDSAQGFLAMVKEGYPMVVHHSTYRFLEPRIGFHRSWQMVRMADLEGNVWIVVYQLYRAEAGGWLIGGVFVLPGAPVPDLEPPSQGT